jgi:hypothetical protein
MEGVYAGGPWFAVAKADKKARGRSRISDLLDDDSDHGPWGSDVAAMKLWTDPPDWISVGATPDEALKNLLETENKPAPL